MMDRETRALAGEVGALLRTQAVACVTAESCTGGLLAGALTACPGASEWFDRGFVTYSNAAKMEQLRVSSDTLEHFGAVSEETAMDMAAGLLAVVPKAGLALSTTGVAGPNGGTPGKPVGMVCFGVARRVSSGIVTRADIRLFEGDRDQIRWAAVQHALHLAREALQAA